MFLSVNFQFIKKIVVSFIMNFEVVNSGRRKLFKTCGQEEVTNLITTQNFFLLVPGQDMYKDSGNAKILDFFGLVPKL